MTLRIDDISYDFFASQPCREKSWPGCWRYWPPDFQELQKPSSGGGTQQWQVMTGESIRNRPKGPSVLASARALKIVSWRQQWPDQNRALPVGPVLDHDRFQIGNPVFLKSWKILSLWCSLLGPILHIMTATVYAFLWDQENGETHKYAQHATWAHLDTLTGHDGRPQHARHPNRRDSRQPNEGFGTLKHHSIITSKASHWLSGWLAAKPWHGNFFVCRTKKGGKKHAGCRLSL